jgi:hypothetical protein
MNKIMREYFPTFQMYQDLRNQLLATLADEDLSFHPGGANPPLGALCRTIGEVEHAYIQSFKTFSIDFSYRHPDPSIERSVERLSAWFAGLDRELQTVVESLSDADIEQRVVDRGRFSLPPLIQLNVYQEALLIFYGKAIVYLRAMGKPAPQQWQDWLG